MKENKKSEINNLKLWVKSGLQYRDTFSLNDKFKPSKFWEKNNNFLSYIFDLSPENLESIRAHIGMGYFIGGPWHSDYFNGANLLDDIDATRLSPIVQKYIKLTSGLPQKLWGSEPKTNDLVSSIGINYKDKLINSDIVKEQACINNLYNLGLIQDEDDFGVIVEIGPGYGQLAFQLSSAYPKKTFILIDYPETLFWSGTFLIANSANDSAVCLWRDGMDINEIIREDKHRFILMPNFSVENLGTRRIIDLVINQNSFQEMSDVQLSHYVNYFSNISKGWIYSYNAEKQFMNKELNRSVIQLINDRYRGEASIGYAGNPAVNFENKYLYMGYPAALKTRPSLRVGANYKAWVSDTIVQFNPQKNIR